MEMYFATCHADVTQKTERKDQMTKHKEVKIKIEKSEKLDCLHFVAFLTYSVIKQTYFSRMTDFLVS